jgi:internalin A
MDNTGVRDLSPIADLTNLAVLNVDNTGVRDLSPIAGLTNLTYLSACQDGLRDIAAISAMKNLQFLQLPRNRIVSVPDLSGFDNLIIVELDNNDISCIDGLRGMVPREDMFPIGSIDLSNNQIIDVSPLADGNIMSLNLANNRISDISPLAGLGVLCHLDLRGNPLNQAAYDTYLPLFQSRYPTADILYDPLPEPAMATVLLMGCLSFWRKRGQ